MSLYTYIPPVRDDYGEMRIVKDRLRSIKEKGNIINIETGEMKIREYKTAWKYGTIKINLKELAPELYEIILESYKRNPREYLITQRNNTTQKIYAEGELSRHIIRKYGISINNIRRSFRTVIYNNMKEFRPSEIRWINYIMGHSMDQSMEYVRKTKQIPPPPPSSPPLPPSLLIIIFISL